MPRAVVKEFRPEAGFGTLTFEDGSEMPFDIAASNKRDVRPGEGCEASVAIGRTGRPKVTLVLFPLQADRTTKIEAFVAYAHGNGLLTEWSMADARREVRDLFDEDRGHIDQVAAAALLEAYYGHGTTPRARQDRVLVLDWRHGQEEDAVAAFTEISGVAGVRAVQRPVDGVVLVDDAGIGSDESVDLTGTLQALSDWFDDLLERKGRPERWWPVESRSDFEIFVLRDPASVRQSASDLPLLPSPA